MFKFILAALTGLCLMTPTAAPAQDVPSYATERVPGDQDIHGRVTAFSGGYNLSVRDERGYIDNVQLHPGTIINPTGLTLAPGMIVSILGYNAGNYFSANQIDTPYQFDSGIPYYANHPWDYYGPSVSLGFYFGNSGWWHGRAFGGGYHYVGGARAYNTVHMEQIYRQPVGTFHGRDFVGAPERGGYYGHGEHGGHGQPGGERAGGHGGGEHGRPPHAR